MITLKGYKGKFNNKVWFEGERIFVKDSHIFKKYSTKFSWGSSNTGAEQLSFAVLLKYCYGAKYEKFVDLALANYQDFKDIFIAQLPELKFKVKVDIALYLKKGEIKWENI